jgi:hypothetical protein
MEKYFMATEPGQAHTQRRERGSGLKSWAMVGLTFGFILMYAAVLTGWLRPMADDKSLARLEPIIFMIIGYYFGRQPSQEAEGVLRSEITRQTQKADAAQHAKEQAQQAREALEERVRSVRSTLAAAAPDAAMKSFAENINSSDGPMKQDKLRQSVAAALNILNS